MANNLAVGAPGIRLIRRFERGEEGEPAGADVIMAAPADAEEGSWETAAIASSSVMRRLSFSTLVNWVAASKLVCYS